MKDFLGNELVIGDNIVASVSHGKNAGASLVKGKIVGFTAQYVKAELPRYWASFGDEERLISSNKVIKMANPSVI